MSRRAAGKGFTLVELLVVLAVLGILSGVAVARYRGERERAIVAMMKTDLRNLVLSEHVFAGDSGTYTAVIGPGGISYNTSAGVSGPTISVSASGFTAWVAHGSTTKTCAVFVGPTPLGPAVRESEPTCQ